MCKNKPAINLLYRLSLVSLSYTGLSRILTKLILASVSLRIFRRFNQCFLLKLVLFINGRNCGDFRWPLRRPGQLQNEAISLSETFPPVATRSYILEVRGRFESIKHSNCAEKLNFSRDSWLDFADFSRPQHSPVRLDLAALCGIKVQI